MTSANIAAITSLVNGRSPKTIREAFSPTPPTRAGKGTWDGTREVENVTIRVTLSTGISEEHCRALHLGYLNPRDIDIADESWFLIPDAGETLYYVHTIAS